MRQKLTSEYRNDADGRMLLRTTTGLGFHIEWQDGPLRSQPNQALYNPEADIADDLGANGAIVEGVVQAAIDGLSAECGVDQPDLHTQAVFLLVKALHALDRLRADQEKVSGPPERPLARLDELYPQVLIKSSEGAR